MEIDKLGPSGTVTFIFIVVEIVLLFCVSCCYFLQSNKLTRMVLKPMKIAIKKRTWTLLIFAILCIIVDIIAMILWLAIFFSVNIAEWVGEASPQITTGFYIELASIIVIGVGVVLSMFWKSA